jgi:hypothetical protein
MWQSRKENVFAYKSTHDKQKLEKIRFNHFGIGK